MKPYYLYICNGEVSANDYSDYQEVWQAAKYEAMATGSNAHIYKLHGNEDTIEDGLELCVIDEYGDTEINQC